MATTIGIIQQCSKGSIKSIHKSRPNSVSRVISTISCLSCSVPSANIWTGRGSKLAANEASYDDVTPACTSGRAQRSSENAYWLVNIRRRQSIVTEMQ